MNIQPVPAQIIIQQTYEEGFHDGYRQAMREMPEIVRCKDCKKQFTSDCLLMFFGMRKSDDWYCADGVKEDDSK